ncbi:MAG: hypothetical protein JXB42_12375 [Deltaproteobacteria bacterium]|nr:hypothetical protein [Deltaproteobacteria bacterium]
MITIFASPKPFTDPHINMIQRNAIQSWMALRPTCDIILFGDEPGTSEIAEEFNLKHVPNVECNKEGLPLVRDMFHRAEIISKFDILTYINADIILFSDFTEAVTNVQQYIAGQPFLMVGQRFDLEITELINFSTSAWKSNLRRQITTDGKLHGESGIDYMVFVRGLWTDVPPIVIGRIAYDNWLIFKARTLGFPVVDATKVVTAIHQKHQYVFNGFIQEVNGQEKLNPDFMYWRRCCPEAIKQLQMTGGDRCLFNIGDASHILSNGGLNRVPLTVKRIFRCIDQMQAFHKGKPTEPLFIGLKLLAKQILIIKRLTTKLSRQ